MLQNQINKRYTACGQCGSLLLSLMGLAQLGDIPNDGFTFSSNPVAQSLNQSKHQPSYLKKSIQKLK
jgi:hypothetical protein